MSKSLPAGSFVLGALSLGLFLFLTSSSMVGGGDLRSLLVRSAPQPRDHVRILEGTPYRVPPGRLLTLKAFSPDGSSTAFNSSVRVEVEGQGIGTLIGYGSESGVEEIPFGITIGEGRTLNLVNLSSSPSGAALFVVYGYLSDA